MHILVVEDDLIVADIICMTSEEAGYFNTIANTIETALFGLIHNQIALKIADAGVSGVVIDTIWGQG